jgi:hypothetical protein
MESDRVAASSDGVRPPEAACDQAIAENNVEAEPTMATLVIKCFRNSRRSCV